MLLLLLQDANMYKDVVKMLLFSRYGTYACDIDTQWLTSLVQRVLGGAAGADNLDSSHVTKVFDAVSHWRRWLLCWFSGSAA